MSKKFTLSELGSFKNGLNFSATEVASGCKMIGIPDFSDNYIAPQTGLKEIDKSIVSKEYLLESNDILFVRSNGNKELVGRTILVENINEPTTFSGFCIRYRPNKLVYPLYMLYLFKSPMFKQILSRTQQTSISNINQDILGKVEIELPSFEKQEEIANAIHLITRKIELNKKVNDNLEQQMSLIYEDMMSNALANRINGDFTTAKELTVVVTGKEDANFSSANGKYKFFTCSNTPLQCDKMAFNSSSILIAGNGDFNVKHYSGEFNAYQRTYVLTPPKEYYGLLYLSSFYRINSFKSGSAGSIVKFITKSDVENIPVFIPESKSYLDCFNNLVFAQEKIALENEELIKLRDWLLPMLMNGQATISD